MRLRIRVTQLKFIRLNKLQKNLLRKFDMKIDLYVWVEYCVCVCVSASVTPVGK